MAFTSKFLPRGSKVASSVTEGTLNISQPLVPVNFPVGVPSPKIASHQTQNLGGAGTAPRLSSVPATQLGADVISAGSLNALLNGADREGERRTPEGISKDNGTRNCIDPYKDGGGAGISVRRSCQSLGGGMGSCYEDAHIRQLIENKERELHDIHDFRIRSLEDLLEEHDAALRDSFARYDKLKEDFKFNLGLIEDRDAELGRLEVALQDLKDCLRDKEVEASELKMSLDEALSAQRQAGSREKEQRSYWQAKCTALRDEIDGLRWAREEDGRAARESSEAAKAALTRQLREREDQLEAQRLDAAETFDRMMQQREEENKARESELTFQLREAEAQAAERARQRERAERELTALKESSKKVRRALGEEEKTARNLRWELEDRQQMAAAELEEASKRAEGWEEKYKAVVAKGEDRVRDVLQSLHAVEKAFVQHKDRHEMEEQALKHKKEELLASLEACRARVCELEAAVADGDKREENLRGVVRAAREDHQREVVALRKKLTDEEASRQQELDQANAAAAALRDANLSLESMIAGLEDEETCLKEDKKEEEGRHARATEELKRSLEFRTKEAEDLRDELSKAREELKRSERQRGEQEEAASRARRKMEAELEDLRRRQQQRHEQQGSQNQLTDVWLIRERGLEERHRSETQEDEAQATQRLALEEDWDRVLMSRPSILPPAFSDPPGKDASPLFSDDKGPSSPIPPLLGLPDSKDFACKTSKNASPATGKHAGGLAFGSDDTSGMSQEVSELKATNLRLRGVVADMRKEMERLRDPDPAVIDAWRDGREQQLMNEVMGLRAELSAVSENKMRATVQAGAPRASMEEVSKLQVKCRSLKADVERLTEERDKLMEIGNGMRAELNRVLSASYQRENGLESDRASGLQAEAGEAAIRARVDEAVARAQGETRRKYSARVAEIETAFAQLTADNRRLRARLGQLAKEGDSELQTYVVGGVEPGEAFISGSVLKEGDVHSTGGSEGLILSPRSLSHLRGDIPLSASVKRRERRGGPGSHRERLYPGDGGDEAGGLTKGPYGVHLVENNWGGALTKPSHRSSSMATAGKPSWSQTTRRSTTQYDDSASRHLTGGGNSRRGSKSGWVPLDSGTYGTESQSQATKTERGRELSSAPAALQGGLGHDPSLAMLGDQSPVKKIPPTPPQPRIFLMPSSSSQRQTEGQRAAAQRLKAWQERRKRDKHRESTVRRAVRNYNMKDDDGV